MIEIVYSNGRTVTEATLEHALAHIRAEYPEAVFYDQAGWEVGCVDEHDEQALQREEARILAWATEAESIQDDGVRAVASLRWRH